MTLAPMLNRRGKLIGDFTVARLASDHFYIFGSGPAETYHMRWFQAHLPASGVTIRPLGLELTGFSIAGPNSRDVLAALAGDDVSNEAFRFMAFRKLDLDRVPALVGRISFTGDLGYEIWVKPDYQRLLLDLLLAAGIPARHPPVRQQGARLLAFREEFRRVGRANTGRSTRRSKLGSIASSISTRASSSAAKPR